MIKFHVNSGGSTIVLLLLHRVYYYMNSKFCLDCLFSPFIQFGLDLCEDPESDKTINRFIMKFVVVNGRRDIGKDIADELPIRHS